MSSRVLALIYSVITVLLSLNASGAAVTGGIATDGTMGAAQTLIGDNIIVPQNLGSTVGNNLFHSFTEFNIANDQTVEFTGSDALQNVISRVTGTDVTEIEGTFKSSIANAVFYFINPNGITFGANAVVDVPGAVHYSTADKIDFPNTGAVFYADSGRASTLSSEPPAAFGFLDTSTNNNGLIEVNGSELSVQPGKTLDLAAGDVTIKNHANLQSEAGTVKVLAVGTGNVNIPIAGAAPTLQGVVSVDSSTLDSSGNGAGHLILHGGSITVTNSHLFADNTGGRDAGNGRGIDISADEGALTVNQSLITSDTLSSGDAGTLSIASKGDMSIVNGGEIFSSALSSGKAGNVTVTSGGRLTIDSQGFTRWVTGIASLSDLGSGDSGTVSIASKGDMFIVNGGQVFSSTLSSGNAGAMTVASGGNLTIDGQGSTSWAVGIFSDAEFGSGDAGTVSVTSKGDMVITQGGMIGSSTWTAGKAGIVTVASEGKLLIDGQGSIDATGIFSATESGSSGVAGVVSVSSKGDMDIVNEGAISSSTRTAAKAGSVNVASEGKLTIDGQESEAGTGIASQAEEGSGQAGNVTVRAGAMEVLNGGTVSSSTFSEGDAGSVSVAADTLRIDGPGQRTGIVSDAEPDSGGNAGNVTVRAGALSLNNLAVISSNTYAVGSAGTVRVNTGTAEVLGGSGISSASLGAYSSGITGNVVVTADAWLHLHGGGHVSIENQGNVSAADAALIRPGAITVAAPDVDMKGSEITSNSSGNIAAGNIVVNASHRLTMDPSFIITTANTGNGGAIVINGGELIFLQNSGFKTSVSGANSNGGDIFVQADTLVMDNGLIQANAVGGSGGNIALDLTSLIPSANTLIKEGSAVDWQPFISGLTVIQAASQAGVSGAVSVIAPQLNLSGIIANLGGPQFNTGIISQDYCGLGTGSALTRKGAGGLKPKSGDQLLF